MIWRSNQQLKIDNNLRDELGRILAFLQNKKNQWEKSIAHIIQREPNTESWGDASQMGIGFWSEHLEVFYCLAWPIEIHQRFKLKPGNKRYIHINEGEFVAIIIQMAAVIHIHENSVTTTYQKKCFPFGLPKYLLHRINSDNISAKKWSNKATAHSIIACNLVNVLGQLLNRTPAHFDCIHISGDSNERADDCSRPPLIDFYKSNIQTLFQQQLLTKHPSMKSWMSFHPSQELISIICAALQNNARIRSPQIPKHLGQLKPASCIISNGAWRRI